MLLHFYSCALDLRSSRQMDAALQLVVNLLSPCSISACRTVKCAKLDSDLPPFTLTGTYPNLIVILVAISRMSRPRPSLLHYKLYLVCKIREHMNTTGGGPEDLRKGAWAEQKWDDEKLAIDQVT